MKDNTSSLSLFTDKTSGGILDDLIVTKCEDHLYIVSNASRREHDSNLMLKRQVIRICYEILVSTYVCSTFFLSIFFKCKIYKHYLFTKKKNKKIWREHLSKF